MKHWRSLECSEKMQRLLKLNKFSLKMAISKWEVIFENSRGTPIILLLGVFQCVSCYFNTNKWQIEAAPCKFVKSWTYLSGVQFCETVPQLVGKSFSGWLSNFLRAIISFWIIFPVDIKISARSSLVPPKIQWLINVDHHFIEVSMLGRPNWFIKPTASRSQSLRRARSVSWF